MALVETQYGAGGQCWILIMLLLALAALDVC
jgi:hypothetical protein